MFRYVKYQSLCLEMPKNQKHKTKETQVLVLIKTSYFKLSPCVQMVYHPVGTCSEMLLTSFSYTHILQSPMLLFWDSKVCIT